MLWQEGMSVPPTLLCPLMQHKNLITKAHCFPHVFDSSLTASSPLSVIPVKGEVNP